MAKTLRDFWNKADGVYDFVDKNGVSIDDMNYPLETEVLKQIPSTMYRSQIRMRFIHTVPVMQSAVF